MRITAKDVRGMFGRAMRAAEANGIDVTGWRLDEGSSTCGISWKLTIRPYGSLGVGWGSNHLGMSAREAYDALHYMARAWELVGEIVPRQALVTV